MELLKTPSVQSLLDSDLESVGSLQYLDIEELDEIEYALPASDAPSLEEVLSAEDEEVRLNNVNNEVKTKSQDQLATCSALQIDFMQAVSQQIKQAQERASAGGATALGVGTDGKITVGTAHGHLMSFFDQTLRWVCNSNSDGYGAVSCISYNKDSTRILVGYARGHISQYESASGTILRHVTLGGEIWGILRVTWAGTSGLALDTGGSVWLIKFSRPLGVRSARTSCLFSGARGEVVAMTARDARVLALATLSRVVIVAGGRAAGLRLSGPPDTLPVVEWSETDEKVLLCARANVLQWLTLTITGASISLRPIKKVELKFTPLWLGWLGGNLAIFDVDENLRLWGEDYDKPLELSSIEPVYASAFYKGHWTDGRVSRAMCMAGGSALAGACVVDGALSLLGRRGVVRVRPRDILTRAQALFASTHHSQALRLLCSSQGADAKTLAEKFVLHMSERPHILSNKNVADLTVKLCLKYGLHDELWTNLWEHCSSERAFVEALGDAAVRGELNDNPPSPDSTQALLERLGGLEPELVERVVTSLPLPALDPHRATVFARERGLWRGVGAIAAAIGGWSGALRTLSAHVSAACGARGGRCACAGAALVLAAADALAGRGAGGRALPAHRRPSARHDALHALLAEESGCGGRSPLRVLMEHEAAAGVRLLEQCAREPPFAGPLAKQNRLRVARHLLAFAHTLPEVDDRVEILEFLTGQLNSGALPADREVSERLLELAAGGARSERGDRAWLALLARATPATLREQRVAALAAARPRVLWRLDATLDDFDAALEQFFHIDRPSETDLDELFEYLRAHMGTEDGVRGKISKFLPALIELRPRAAAALVGDELAEAAAAALATVSGERVLEFGESLREAGSLRGEAAAAHLRNLCRLRPAAVRRFLVEEAGAVRPEEALAAVRASGVEDAEPLCLEAAGDGPAALDALLRLAATAPAEEAARCTLEAGELCARVAPAAPPAVAAAMWARLVRAARDLSPALLVEALAYLPPEEAREMACRSAEAARALQACAASGRHAWALCARVADREAHEALARALVAARRGVAVRGRCARCGGRLAERAAARTEHCARAAHADCEAEGRCAVCGAPTPAALLPLPPRLPPAESPPLEFALALAAPPRPDLEGVV